MKHFGNKKYANLRNKSSQKTNIYYLLTPIAIQIQRLDYSDELAIYDAKTIVLGYGGYEKIANSFLNKLIRFELYSLQ
jgi:hypothetical protein